MNSCRDFKVFRHRENQLMRRAQELEEMITQQNNTIMTMLSGAKGKEEKSQVNLSVDFVSGKLHGLSNINVCIFCPFGNNNLF